MQRIISYSKYLLIAATFICLTSCATINVQKEFSRHTKACTPYFKNNRNPTATYGGAIADVYFISAAVAQLADEDPPEATLTILVLATADLPFSFLLDTVLIPVSIPRDVIRIAKCSF